jgi:hypothetical protein
LVETIRSNVTFAESTTVGDIIIKQELEILFGTNNVEVPHENNYTKAATA